LGVNSPIKTSILSRCFPVPDLLPTNAGKWPENERGGGVRLSFDTGSLNNDKIKTDGQTATRARLGHVHFDPP